MSHSHLPPPSSDQQAIIDKLHENYNIIIDSVAGSGKTTTNLHIAKAFTNKKILLLTYNSKLRLETKKRVQAMEFDNIDVHTYHSFAVKNYNRGCFDDTILYEVIVNNILPIQPFHYDIIILDEAQDITDVFHRLICKVYKNNERKDAQLVVLGDKKQCIYNFKDADYRYIEYADKAFNLNNLEWARCNLPISFRITQEMALFINHCMIGFQRIMSNKVTGIKPRYLICDPYGRKPYEEVKYYLNLGYKPGDIFILSNTVNQMTSPIKRLENSIKIDLPDIPVYVSISDNERIDESMIRDKIVFTTFHQCKGLERKVVIVYCFDIAYMQFVNTKCNPMICPNELYVAVTRGLERLTVIHNKIYDYLPFLDKKNIEHYCDCGEKRLDSTNLRRTTTTNNYNKKIAVTDILRFLPQQVIDTCYNKLQITKNTDYKNEKIKLPTKVIDGNTSEQISDIIGIAIPSMFEYKLTNKMTIYENLLENKEYKLENISLLNITPDQLFYISTVWVTHTNRFMYRLSQIKDYKWIGNITLNKLISRLMSLNISKTSVFDKTIPPIINREELLNTVLSGDIDCIDEDNNTVYEFKCVKQLEKVHYLQLALYMYMYTIAKDPSAIPKYVLFNITTNEYMEVKCSFSDLTSIVRELIYHRLESNKEDTDDEFIEKAVAVLSS
jgi:hypothetical protein